MARLDIRVAVVVALVASAMPALAVDIEPFIRRSDFGTVKISPGGEYIAATVPMENTTALAVMRLSDGKVTGGGTLGKHRHVDEIWWVNDERLLFSSSEKMGMLDQPRSTGDIYATTASRNVAEVLVGQSVDVQAVGSRLGACGAMIEGRCPLRTPIDPGGTGPAVGGVRRRAARDGTIVGHERR
jgi:hypothetical protein